MWIRPVEMDDVSGIQLVARESWMNTYKESYPLEFIMDFLGRAYSTERLEQAVKRDLERSERQFLVAEDSTGNIVGYAQVTLGENKTHELARIYILTTHQGNGIGRAFITEFRSRINDMDTLTAWVEAANSSGRMFYEKMGFRMINEKIERFGTYETSLVCYEQKGGSAHV
ncbi:GNAT family N-acetyltransferase [Paenibacillus swuensis]|uniref:GNAT family N-acetyltransferase n=1 Tax=Paenibacillus swuensis TaxID=1178515 RepID=UPI0008396BBF|nr:GNAT family N-acetyltransferase [Paenibacillus swuensis]